jgi:hypothetical protein
VGVGDDGGRIRAAIDGLAFGADFLNHEVKVIVVRRGLRRFGGVLRFGRVLGKGSVSEGQDAGEKAAE